MHPQPDLQATRCASGRRTRRACSAAADQPYGQNWARVRSPVVDDLIEHIIGAKSAEDLYAATRALDRILMWNFYFIPLGVAARIPADLLGQVRRSAQRPIERRAVHRRVVVG